MYFNCRVVIENFGGGFLEEEDVEFSWGFMEFDGFI